MTLAGRVIINLEQKLKVEKKSLIVFPKERLKLKKVNNYC
jgi:hypothetical protein